QFSLGVMLYEMAAGTRPFQGETWAVVLAKILEVEPQPLRRLRPEISPELEALVHRCLRKNPEERYADTAELARHLRALAAGGGAPGTGGATLAVTPTIKMTALGATLLVTALAVFFYLARGRTAPSSPPTPPSPSLPATQSSAIAVLPFVFHGDAQ